MASLHTALQDSRDDVHFLFKSSPFGTQSHGHNPHNTFQLNAYGECLLTTCVYRDLHGSRFHYEWAHSTVAHNGVLVNGEGQIKHTPAPHGRIAEVQLTPQWDYVVGDATDAYGGRLARFHRHVVFVKPRAAASATVPFIVVCDDLEAKEPSTFQFMLHGLRAFEIDESKARLSTEQQRAGVDVQYLSTTALRFRQWDGFTPPPSREFSNQWHVKASTVDKQPQLAMLTVIVPYREGQRPEWSAERIETDEAVGVRMVSGRERTTVSIPKPNKSGTIRVERE
ncbi:MAG: heparinase II/III family protein [Planctomycetes bacterium]|nr:heparinase II/III family protein [Planctomycetota bacterium]